MKRNRGGWGGRRAQAIRAQMATQLPCLCWRCGTVIHPTDRWVVGHVVDRAIDPSRTWDPSNHRLEHHTCNAQAGGRLGNQRQRARQQARRQHPPPRRWA